ncbi:DNA cytosine methyltransferase [Lacrimispora sp.]|uniref:DNA cytosine methyltransferase n=1 Tax=Lacrimispora sp. TaxID=2719234 RepID=UPI0028A854E0|nr:DNA (cytosine-5-)-methyltransferase [Lacrimispora sp.]
MGLTFIDYFAGIGGFRRGMEMAGHKCVGFCEFDKYAVMSYTMMHLATEEQRKYIESIPALRERQKEILKEEYRNGEWYANDIRRVEARSLPKADCWCFGFPCQDISIAGKQLGFSGRRSSLFFAVTGLIKDLSEEDRPSILFIENVKNLLSVNRGIDFARLLIELDEIGYDAEWCVLNSKDFGVPQNRERVFIVGRFRGRGGREVFPVARQNTRNRIVEESRINKNRHSSLMNSVLNVKGITPALDCMQGGNRQPKIQIGTKIRKLTPCECFRLQGWTDKYYDRAAKVNSDSQLYKQAGNGVTVNVIQAIAERF